MKYDEYEEKINEVLSNPDTALTEISSVLEELKGDLETLEALSVKVEEQDGRIRDLQDTNMKLYLNQGGGEVEQEEEDEPAEGMAVIDEFMEELFEEEEE